MSLQNILSMSTFVLTSRKSELKVRYSLQREMVSYALVEFKMGGT